MALISKYSLNGNANDLVWSNNWTALNVVWVDGKMNQSASFDGSSSYIQVPYSSDFDLLSFTISMYFRRSDNLSRLQDWFILSKQSNIYWWNNFSIRMWYWKDITNWIIDWLFYSWTTWYTIQTNIPILDTNYHNVTFTFGSWIWNIYIDWKLINSSVTWLIPLVWNYPLFIWQDSQSYDNNRRFKWIIDEIEIYNHVLTAAEIKNKYLYYNGFYNV